MELNTGRIRRGLVVALAGATLMLSACEEPEQVLAGKREPIDALLGDDAARAATAVDVVSRAAPIRLPAEIRNADWPQEPGTERLRTTHAALGPDPKLVWTAAIGEGDGKRQRITANPVVAGGRVFTLDSASHLVATSTQGSRLWSADLGPTSADKPSEATGGGIAYGDGKLFVTTGWGALFAVDPADGRVLWRQKLGATASGAPAYAGGLVYVVAGDTTAWAVEADNGRVRWQVGSIEDINNILGAPAPALTDELVIFAYGSGDLQGVFRQGGLQLWNSAVLGQRKGSAPATVLDFTGAPMVAGDRVYVGTSAGRLTAANVNDGERLWTVLDGSLEPAWPVGGSVFAITDRNELVRLDASDGSRIWKVDLPNFVPRRRPTRRAPIYANHGPILAGGRLVVASGDGWIRFFDPGSGALTGRLEIPGGATTAPVVAGNTLYVVSRKGVLHAYR